MIIDKSESTTFAFQTVLQALRYFHLSPVRIKSINLLEPDSQRGSVLRDGVASEDKYAAVVLAVRNTVGRGSAPYEHKMAFALRHLIQRDKQLHWDDIARELGRSASSVRRWVSDLEEDVAKELVQFGVLDPEYLEELRGR